MKVEYPSILPIGFNAVTIDEVREICVGGFPTSSTRPEIMAGLDAIYEEVRRHQLPGEMWVDGSFLTQKENPPDIDLVFMVPALYYDDKSDPRYDIIEWLINKERDPKASFYCDTDVALMQSTESPFHGELVESLDHFRDLFCFSRTGVPKGVAIVSLDEVSAE